jgi:hypothetical protein
MFALITTDIDSTELEAGQVVELYDTVQEARDWVEISQGYDLEAGELQQYSIYALTEVAIDSEQNDGFFVFNGPEMHVYDSFEEMVDRINYDNESAATIEAEYLEEFGAEFVANWKQGNEAATLYRLADEATQVITEVIDEELLAA